MVLKSVTVDNPFLGKWEILTNIPEYLFESIFNKYIDNTELDNISDISFCQFTLENGYVSMTDEVYNILNK